MTTDTAALVARLRVHEERMAFLFDMIVGLRDKQTDPGLRESLNSMKYVLSGRPACVDEAISALESISAPAVLETACEPWKNYDGDPPEYDSPLDGVFGSGISYAEARLAELLGVKSYHGCDGTETLDGDVRGTLANILKAAGYVDADGDLLAPEAARAAIAALPRRDAHTLYCPPCGWRLDVPTNHIGDNERLTGWKWEDGAWRCRNCLPRDALKGEA